MKRLYRMVALHTKQKMVVNKRALQTKEKKNWIYPSAVAMDPSWGWRPTSIFLLEKVEEEISYQAQM